MQGRMVLCSLLPAPEAPQTPLQATAHRGPYHLGERWRRARLALRRVVPAVTASQPVTVLLSAAGARTVVEAVLGPQHTALSAPRRPRQGSRAAPECCQALAARAFR